MLGFIRKKNPINVPALLEKLHISSLFSTYWKSGNLSHVNSIPILTSIEEVKQYYEDILEHHENDCLQTAFYQHDYYIVLFPCLNKCGSEESLAGFLYANRTLDNILQISYVCSIKKTIGSFLMMIIILISLEIGIKKIKLTAVGDVKNFYAKFGFIQDSGDLSLDLSIYNQERIEQLKKNERIDFGMPYYHMKRFEREDMMDIDSDSEDEVNKKNPKLEEENEYKRLIKHMTDREASYYQQQIDLLSKMRADSPEFRDKFRYLQNFKKYIIEKL